MAAAVNTRDTKDTITLEKKASLLGVWVNTMILRGSVAKENCALQHRSKH